MKEKSGLYVSRPVLAYQSNPLLRTMSVAPEGPAAAAAAAPAAASANQSDYQVSQNAAGQFKYNPAPGIKNLMQYDRNQQHALHNAIKSNQRENEARRVAQKQAETEKKSNEFLPVVLECLPIPSCSDEDLQKMREAHAAVEAAGGIEAISEMKKLCDDTDATLAERTKKDEAVTAKSTERASTNRIYRDSLAAKGLSSNSVYMVEWNSLHKFASFERLPVAYSFAILMSDCEIASKNPEANPEKLHLRLALVVYNEVNELYCDYREGMMRKVTKSNAKELCERVFQLDNLTTLHASDGGHGTIVDYKKKLVHDSVMTISGRIPDFYSTLAEYTQETGETGLRARSGVNYCERRNKKRTRHNASASSSTSQNQLEELESGDEVEVEVQADEAGSGDEGGAVPVVASVVN